jgi:hypothetical protein
MFLAMLWVLLENPSRVGVYQVDFIIIMMKKLLNIEQNSY